jgi:hypothetical protein
LWLPTATGLRGSDQSFLNSLSSKQGHLSSFSTLKLTTAKRNLLKTSWLSYTYSLAGSTENEPTLNLTKAEQLQRAAVYKGKNKTDKAVLKQVLDQKQPRRVTRCKLVELDATPKQHALIKLWFKDARKTYNLVMMDVLKSYEYKNIDANLSCLEVALVKQYVSEQGLCDNKRLVIMLRTPNVIRQQAVKSVMAVLKQYHTQVAKREMLRKKYPKARAFRRNIRFNPGFKSKKMTHDSISIERKSFSFVDSGCCNIFRTWTTR